MNRSNLSTSLLLIAAFGLALITAGCGGKGLDFAPWVANYTGSGSLDNGKTGDLAVSCDAAGVVTGTLTVTGADGVDTLYKFTAGVYNVSGSITSTSGDFEVTGTVPVDGDFFIRGKLPTATLTPRTYTVVTSTSVTFLTSQHYTGSLQRN